MTIGDGEAGLTDVVRLSELVSVADSLCSSRCKGLGDRPYKYPDYVVWIATSHTSGDLLSSCGWTSDAGRGDGTIDSGTVSWIEFERSAGTDLPCGHEWSLETSIVN